jgi:hypothetical protein
MTTGAPTFSHDSAERQCAEKSPASEGGRYAFPGHRSLVTATCFHESRITFNVGAPTFALRERNQSKDRHYQHLHQAAAAFLFSSFEFLF